MRAIKHIQNNLIFDGLLLLFFIPIYSLFSEMSLPAQTALFSLSFFTAFLLMIIRPLADIFVELPLLRKLVVLRKGLGILSASIIVGFMLAKIMAPGSAYLASIFSANFYSLKKFNLFAHSGDLSGLLVLSTSNKYSQKILTGNWKRLQKLAYVYFYSSGIYEAFFLNNQFALYALIVVTGLTSLAWAQQFFQQQTESPRKTFLKPSLHS